ncbi:MAG: NAD(P)-dependent alcohol dehydrogenase [Actinomycetota bacterium]|nr:NAD(P)-dependent alcohol dehydrogenase [Actinomycetota bacterium]
MEPTRPATSASPDARMTAIVHRRYGGPEVLERVELPRPVPGPGQVLVRVEAASINSADVRLMAADPFLVRLQFGLRRPRHVRALGRDVAGVVEALGDGAARFAVGDRVFGELTGDSTGAFADDAVADEGVLAPIPDGVEPTVAAAVPLAGVTALQAVRDLGRVGPGSEVLVQGAGGGVGGFAVQIAKAYGATVTASASAASGPLVAGYGADRVVDYATTDVTDEGRTYDVVLGVNGHRSLRAYRRCLRPGGRYVMVGGENRQLFAGLLLGRLLVRGDGRSCRVLTIDESRRRDDLAELSDLLTGGALRPVIDRTFPLADAAEAITYVRGGHVRGKVVLTATT